MLIEQVAPTTREGPPQASKVACTWAGSCASTCAFNVAKSLALMVSPAPGRLTRTMLAAGTPRAVW